MPGSYPPAGDFTPIRFRRVPSPAGGSPTDVSDRSESCYDSAAAYRCAEGLPVTVRPRTIHLLVIAGTGLLFTLPHALFGFIGGHDIVPHLQWSTHFSSQLLSGELYPRW